jgi:hypothetical protein
MAVFIQPENQNILWEMVNKIPLCNSVFPSGSGSQNEKQNWFKGMIENFYKRIPPNISRNDLYKINREVLGAMMKSLGELSISTTKQDTIDRGIFSRLDMNNSIETKKTDFEIRQSQYNSMFETQKPKAIDFSEKLDDDVITNMNELIENQRKMRELDLQQFAPKPNDAIQNIKVNILEDVPKEVIQPDVIKNSKHVHFDLSQEQQQDMIKSNEILELKQKIENMDDKINQMFEMLRSLVTPIPTPTHVVTPTITIDVLENKEDEEKDEKNIESVSENIETIKQLMDDFSE